MTISLNTVDYTRGRKFCCTLTKCDVLANPQKEAVI